MKVYTNEEILAGKTLWFIKQYDSICLGLEVNPFEEVWEDISDKDKKHWIELAKELGK